MSNSSVPKDADLPISVVIPTFQRCHAVEQALFSLTKQDLPPGDFEVIVSIDGSEDGTLKMVTQFPASYALHSLWQPNQGRAAACNAGIRAARGYVIVILDDDMQATPGFLTGHLRAHGGCKHVAVVGAAPIHFGPGSPPLARFMGEGFNDRLERFAQPGYQIKFSEAYTGNFSVLKENLDMAGGFDEDFKCYGYEDYELMLRLYELGITLVYSSEALALQGYTKDFRGLARDTVSRGRSAVLFMEKHPQAYPELKLSSYHQRTTLRKLLHAILFGVGRVWRAFPDFVTAGITWLERFKLRNMPLLYILALDYFYWLGVHAEFRENRKTGKGPVSLPDHR